MISLIFFILILSPIFNKFVEGVHSKNQTEDCPDFSTILNGPMSRFFTKSCVLFSNCLGIICDFSSSPDEFEYAYALIDCPTHSFMIQIYNETYKLMLNKPIIVKIDNQTRAEINYKMSVAKKHTIHVTYIKSIPRIIAPFIITIPKDIKTYYCQRYYNSSFNLSNEVNQFISEKSGEVKAYFPLINENRKNSFLDVIMSKLRIHSIYSLLAIICAFLGVVLIIAGIIIVSVKIRRAKSYSFVKKRPTNDSVYGTE